MLNVESFCTIPETNIIFFLLMSLLVTQSYIQLYSFYLFCLHSYFPTAIMEFLIKIHEATAVSSLKKRVAEATILRNKTVNALIFIYIIIITHVVTYIQCSFCVCKFYDFTLLQNSQKGNHRALLFTLKFISQNVIDISSDNQTYTLLQQHSRNYIVNIISIYSHNHIMWFLTFISILQTKICPLLLLDV